METESGAKIAIRGKGSVKEGKGRSDAAHTSNQEEDLHCLIMADTEDKVDKAKELIHKVIETVSVPVRQIVKREVLTTTHRPHPFQKVRTSLSGTSFVNLPRSTVPSVTTRTRPAKTVAKLDTENMIAQRRRTSPPTSSVAFVATRAIWRETAPIVNAAKTGATVLLLVVPVLLLLLATPIKITKHLWAVSPATQAL